MAVEKLISDDLTDAIVDAAPDAPSTSHALIAGHQNAYELTVATGSLNVVVGAGRARIDHTTFIHNATGWTLTANATNYIKITAVGAVFNSTVPFASGQIPLWQIQTNATGVASYTDLRAVFSNGGGGGGGGGGTLDDAYDFLGPGNGRIIDANDGEVLIRNLEADANANLTLQRAPADINTVPSFQVDGQAEANPRMRIYGNRMQGRFDGSAGGTSGADWWLGHYAESVLSLHDNVNARNALEMKTGNEFGTPGSNNLRQYAQVIGAQACEFIKDANGRVFGPLGMKEQATVFGRGADGGWAPGLSANWNDAGLHWGTLAPAGSWTATGAASIVNDTALSSGGRYANFQAAAGVGNDCGVESTAVFWANGGHSWLFRFGVGVASSVRLFVGIAAQTLATMVGADDPGTNHIGIQIPTGRANTNFWFVERGTGAQVATDSGQAISDNACRYLQIITGFNLTRMILYSADFSPLATRAVGATSKPGGATLCRAIIGVENQSAGAARDVRAFQVEQHWRDY